MTLKQPYRTDVRCSYGAPMGRPDTGQIDPDAHGVVHVRMVPLDDGYDPGGAYWGWRPRGEMLFCAWTKDWVRYLDAKSYLAAETRIQADMPFAEFRR